MIYAVHILRTQFVKIGYSQHEDVKRRIAELQTGCPFEILPLFTIDGTLLQEKALHAALLDSFAQIRVPMPPNEWYPGRLPYFKRFLDNLKFGADLGLAFCRQNDALHFAKDVKPNTTERHNLKPNLKWPHKADFTALGQ
jgi:hypothetical protein